MSRRDRIFPNLKVSEKSRILTKGYHRQHEELYNMNIPFVIQRGISIFYGGKAAYSSPPRPNASNININCFLDGFNEMEMIDFLKGDWMDIINDSFCDLEKIQKNIDDEMQNIDVQNEYDDIRNGWYEKLRKLCENLRFAASSCFENQLSSFSNEWALIRDLSSLNHINSNNISLIGVKLIVTPTLYQQMGWNEINRIIHKISRKLESVCKMEIGRDHQYKIYHCDIHTNLFIIFLKNDSKSLIKNICTSCKIQIESIYNKFKVKTGYKSIGENYGHPPFEYIQEMDYNMIYSPTLTISENTTNNRFPSNINTKQEIKSNKTKTNNNMNEHYLYNNIGIQYTQIITGLFREFYIKYICNETVIKTQQIEAMTHCKHRGQEIGYLINTFVMDIVCKNCTKSIPLKINKRMNKKSELITTYNANNKALKFHSKSCNNI